MACMPVPFFVHLIIPRSESMDFSHDGSLSTNHLGILASLSCITGVCFDCQLIYCFGHACVRVCMRSCVCMHTYALIHACVYPVEHKKIVIIIVLLYLSVPALTGSEPAYSSLSKSCPLSNLVNVIQKKLLAEFTCLLLLGRITTVRRQRRQQPRLSPILTKKDKKIAAAAADEIIVELLTARTSEQRSQRR